MYVDSQKPGVVRTNKKKHDVTIEMKSFYEP